MAQNKSFLEVDPTLVEKNLLLRDPEDEELGHLFPPQKDEYPSKLVKPAPGICVKTHVDENLMKIFVNICQTNAIPPPDDISEGQLTTILYSEEPLTYRIPMSIGEARNAFDKQGDSAIVYDVAINPDFFTKVSNSSLFREFVIAVAFEGINQKYDTQLNLTEYVVLKNKKAWGTLQTHRVQQRKINHTMGIIEKPLIEELEGGDFVAKNRTPKYRIIKIIDCKENRIISEMFLPDLVSVKDVNLNIGEDRIVFDSPKLRYYLDIYLPVNIVPGKVLARFNTGNKFLTIIMPLKAD